MKQFAIAEKLLIITKRIVVETTNLLYDSKLVDNKTEIFQ